MRYEIAGVSSLIIYFGESISDDTNDQVLSYYRHLRSTHIPGIIEIIPSYSSLYIEFDIFTYDHHQLFDVVQHLNIDHSNLDEQIYNTITIPTYYHPEVGYDLDRVAQLHNISADEVIRIHSQKLYRVYTVGFLPGFAYMGSVESSIATPRLTTPRLQIAQGSVGIANTQTAVYPVSSPGGWNILGRTHLKLFDKSIDGFSQLRPGDRVRFQPISRDELLSAGGTI